MSRRSKARSREVASRPQHSQPPLRERGEPVPSALPQRRGSWLIPVLIALVTFAAFLPTLQNQFVTWDDAANFLDNPHYRGLAWTHIRWMWTTHLGHYIPLTWMTLGLDYLLWGMNPFGYHLTSLLLHAANAVAFFFVVRRILKRALPSPSERGHALAVSAGFATLVFAIHPLRVESVAWVTERRDVLSGLFYLLTILVYLRASERGARGQGWYWLSVAAFVWALLFNSMAGHPPAWPFAGECRACRRRGWLTWWSSCRCLGSFRAARRSLLTDIPTWQASDGRSWPAPACCPAGEARGGRRQGRRQLGCLPALPYVSSSGWEFSPGAKPRSGGTQRGFGPIRLRLTPTLPSPRTTSDMSSIVRASWPRRSSTTGRPYASSLTMPSPTRTGAWRSFTRAS